ncbi:hypothetical protein K438DRAFT_1767204 [Mycena galopus ATCC 62051]|nr:hypothetical protein K438DRAFT_1767204 [Mycena galopus ATCC 62051]
MAASKDSESPAPAAWRKLKLEPENEQCIEDAESLEFTVDRTANLTLPAVPARQIRADRLGRNALRAQMQPWCPASPPLPDQHPTDPTARPRSCTLQLSSPSPFYETFTSLRLGRTTPPADTCPLSRIRVLVCASGPAPVRLCLIAETQQILTGMSRACCSVCRERVAVGANRRRRFAVDAQRGRLAVDAQLGRVDAAEARIVGVSRAAIRRGHEWLVRGGRDEWWERTQRSCVHAEAAGLEVDDSDCSRGGHGGGAAHAVTVRVCPVHRVSQSEQEPRNKAEQPRLISSLPH